MAETKHEFIDDNPYITYTGKPDTAYDGEGGGGGGGYTLPIASADTLGGVKIGDGLEIAESGALSVDVELGVIQYDNGTLNASFNDLKSLMEKGITPRYYYLFNDDGEKHHFIYECFRLIEEIGNYQALFVSPASSDLNPNAFISSSPTDNFTED